MNKKLSRLLRPNMGVYISVMFLFTIATALLGQYWLALGEFGISAMVLAMYLVFKDRRRKRIKAFVHKTLDDMNAVEGSHSPFPMVAFRMDDNGIIFTNNSFVQLTGFKDTMVERQLDEILPGFATDWLSSGKTEYPYDVTLQKKRFRVYGSCVSAEDTRKTPVGVLFFTDLTELYQVRDEYIRSRPVVSIILVDNQEELVKNLSESAASALTARIDDAISSWTEGYHGLLRRLDKNRFLFIFEKRDLKQAVDEKFTILENVHEIVSPNGVTASISFGLGVDGENFEESYNFASLSIEMALSRGGDQAVIKDRLNFHFYGGRTTEAEHRSKVRSRVTANSLMELIGQSSQVFIMGHRNADMDAVGAAMGVSCMCRKAGKPAHIVLDLQYNMSHKLLEEIQQVPEYKDMFISGQEAIVLSDNRSTLVVVDTNRPDQLECRNLLDAVPKVCVIDHHRRAAEYITPVVVNLHETFASSACELVTELLQYAVDSQDILPIEAKSLMAGLFMDTKSFNVRTGERTFEAAAFLRKLGADTVEVKKLLQNDFQDTMAKYQIIRSAKLYRKEIAISALGVGTTRVLASQAADELLNISGITASFVLFPDDGKVIISARSIGEANVQVILEPLGGGGNAATAGAQVPDADVKDVLDQLVASINKYYAN